MLARLSLALIFLSSPWKVCAGGSTPVPGAGATGTQFSGQPFRQYVDNMQHLRDQGGQPVRDDHAARLRGFLAHTVLAAQKGKGGPSVCSSLSPRPWAVITSVYSIPDSLLATARLLPQACFLIVGDTASPDTSDLHAQLPPNALYLSVALQQELARISSFVACLPWAHFGRKNVGYLLAIAANASWILDLDDDNRLTSVPSFITGPPTQPGSSPYQSSPTSSRPGLGDGGARKGRSRSSAGTAGAWQYSAPALLLPSYHQGVLNPLGLLGASREGVWPRGFPLTLVKGHEELGPVATASPQASSGASLPEGEPRQLSMDGVAGQRGEGGGGTEPLPQQHGQGLPTAGRWVPSSGRQPTSEQEHPGSDPVAKQRSAGPPGAQPQGVQQGRWPLSSVAVIQSVADGDPDVDAVYRLTRPLPVRFQPPFPGRLLVVPRGTVVPYNAQASFHTVPAFWALLLPVTVHGRVSDIWRAYAMQRLMQDLGLHVAYTGPLVVQERHAHSLLADFNAELPLYEQTPALLSFLASWVPPPRAPRQQTEEEDLPWAMLSLFVALYERGFLEALDVELARAWLWELRALQVPLPRSGRAPPLAP